jgi:serine phosphatase RsbU (regulator of sigma subunit)
VDGEEFGEDRLLSVLREHRTTGAKEIQQRILAAAAEFSHHNWTDDATLLVLAIS